LNTGELLISEAIQAEDFRIGPLGNPGLSAFTEKYLFSLTQIDSLPCEESPQSCGFFRLNVARCPRALQF